MTERIVRPAPAHLCGRLVFICEDLWGAAASAPAAWAWHCPARGPEPPCGPSNTPIKPVPIINTEAIVRAWTRSALLHCLSLFLFVLGLNLATTASAALPGPLGADRSQRRKTGRQRATEAIARPGHPDAGKRQDAHGTAEPPEAIARRHQAGYADSPGRHPRLHSRSRRSLEKQLDGPNSPVARWSTLYRQARTEITTGLPAWREWPSLIRDFLIVTAIWAGLALGLRWITDAWHAAARQPVLRPAGRSPGSCCGWRRCSWRPGPSRS